MPCTVDICKNCNEYNCICNTEPYRTLKRFDWEGALCDVLRLLEEKRPSLLQKVDKKTLKMWDLHKKYQDEG